MKAELKSCPFCGGEAERLKSGSIRRSTFICCTVCRASTDYVIESVDYCAKDKAVEAWNRRSEEQAREGGETKR